MGEDFKQALGGNPFKVLATPDGVISQLPRAGGESTLGDDNASDLKKHWAKGLLFGSLIALVVLLLLILLIYRWGNRPDGRNRPR